MRSLNQIIYLRPSSLKFIQQHCELKVDFIFRLQKRNYSKLWKRISSDELDFDFILENKKLENKMKGQKVRAYISQWRNRSADYLTF